MWAVLNPIPDFVEILVSLINVLSYDFTFLTFEDIFLCIMPYSSTPIQSLGCLGWEMMFCWFVWTREHP